MKSLNYYLSWVFALLFLGLSEPMYAIQKCGIVVGGTSFAATGKSATDRYCLSEIIYTGTATQVFEMSNASSSVCRTTGNLTRAGNGDYTIVQQVNSVNGPDGYALHNNNADTDGTFLITPTNNNQFARYKIEGLELNQNYTVKIQLRSARVKQSSMDCNDEGAKMFVRVLKKDGSQNSTNFNGTVTTVSNPDGCGGSTGSWDTNNGGDFNFLRFDDVFYIQATVQTKFNEDGFIIDFKANQDGNTVVGIDYIEITGCIEQEITSSNGTDFCIGNSTVLTAKGIGAATDTYEWKENGTVIAGETGATITVSPTVATTYDVKCIQTNELLSTTINPLDCCGGGPGTENLTIVRKVCNPLVVNGNDEEDEWSGGSWNVVDKVSHVEDGVQANPAGQWKMLFDKDYIYLYIRVFDNQQPYNSFWTADPDDNEGEGYKGDGVEIYLKSSKSTTHPLQLGLTYPTTGVIPGHYKNQGWEVTLDGYDAEIKPWNGTYWEMEVRVPATVNGVDLTGENIGVEVGISQSKTTPTQGTSVRGALLHTWKADGQMYEHMGNLKNDVIIMDCGISTEASLASVCSGSPVVLSTNMIIPSSAQYTWEKSEDGEHYSALSATEATDGNASNNNAKVKPTVPTWYRANYNGALTCPVKVEIISDVSITQSFGDSRCGTGTLQIKATSSDGGQVKWYEVETGGASLGSTDSGVAWTTPSISATTIYYAEAVNSTCPGAVRTSVVATITHSEGGTASADQVICYNTPPAAITLSGHTAGNVQWQYSDTFDPVINEPTNWADIAGATTPTLSPAAMGNLTTAKRYYRAAVQGTGCTDIAYSLNWVTVSTTTINTVTAASSTPTLCTNTALADITHTTTGATGIGTATGLPAGIAATWSAGTITISGTPTASGTFNYTIPLTGGCGTVNATGTITVNALPTISVTNPTICAGGSTTITASGANTYSWSPATGLSATDIADPTASLTTTTTYTVTGTDANGCANTATGTVTVNPIPAIPGVTSVSYCKGVVASPLTASGANLLWYTDATSGTGSATAPTPNTDAEGATSYWVSQTVNGCESPRAELRVQIIESMQINLIAQNEIGAALPNNTSAIKRGVRLEVISVRGETPREYEWSWDDIVLSLETNEMWVYPKKTTTYRVVAKIDDSCSASAEIEIKVKPLPTAFIPSNGEGDINSVFPVSAEAADQQLIKYKNLTVYNRYGQEVYNANKRWDGTLKGGKLASPGTYFYIITFDDGETLKGTVEVIKNKE